jgi:CRP/FNR family transcriptional regulator, cyclic AMP receptor protein
MAQASAKEESVARLFDAPGEVIRILDADREFGYGLSGEDLERARHLATARTEVVDRGPWAPLANGEDHAGRLGLLVIEGLVIRKLTLANTGFCEVLGRGDVLRPWNEDCGFTVAEVDADWTVLEPLRLAVLDHRFAAVAGRWPSMMDVIFSRLVQRSRSLALQLAITHLTRVDVRLLVALWFMAERWGHVTSDGVVVPIRVTHKMLADMVGARRPSVTSALAHLAPDGLAARRSDGAWLLRGEPPDDLRRVRQLVDASAARSVA